MKKIRKHSREAIEAIQSADVPEKLNEARVRFLGKKGELTADSKRNEKCRTKRKTESRPDG